LEEAKKVLVSRKALTFRAPDGRGGQHDDAVGRSLGEYSIRAVRRALRWDFSPPLSLDDDTHDRGTRTGDA
jgi:hypothetical protein